MEKHRKMFILIIIGILCILYGLCVKSIGSGTGFFFVWLGIGMMFELLAACVYFGVWLKLPGVIHKLLIICIAIGIIGFVAIEGCILSSFGAEGEKDLDYIIVLGAQMRESGPSLVLRYRLDKAIMYMEENTDTVCIVSGGQGRNEHISEAEGMAEYLVKNGIPEDRILLEKESMNTVQNIQNSMEYLDEETDTVGIITNNFHLFRSVRIAKKQGIEHVTGIAADSTAFYLPNNMLREFLGLVKDYIVGNL